MTRDREYDLAKHIPSPTPYPIEALDDDPACWYCGRELTVETSTIDHIQPKSKGGTEAAENFRLACRRCNSRKGDHSMYELAGQIRRGAGLHLIRHVRVFRRRAIRRHGDGPLSRQ